MKKVMIMLALLLPSVQGFALETEEANYDDYDTMVNRMSASAPKKEAELYDFNSLNLHYGFGFNNSLINLKSHNGSPDQVTMQGFQLEMGVDLFSPDYVAEVDYLNYNPADKESYSYKLREFDLKVYYHHHLNSFFVGKAGAGLGARYLSVSNPSGTDSSTAPMGIVFVGGEILLGQHLGFISELTYKNALSNDTLEKSSFDLALGVTGHF